MPISSRILDFCGQCDGSVEARKYVTFAKKILSFPLRYAKIVLPLQGNMRIYINIIKR